MMRAKVAAMTILTAGAAMVPVPGLAQEAAAVRITAVEIVSDAESILPPARQAITVRAGEPYRIDDVRDSLQALWAVGLIEDARVETLREAGGVRLRFELVPRVRLWNTRFSGELPLRRSRLRRSLSLRPGQPLNDAEAVRQAERVQSALSDDGYLLARVFPSVEVDGGTRGDLQLHVVAGDRARLRQLTLEGDLGIPEAQVRELLQLRDGEPYRPAQLEEAIERLDSAYVRAHYFYRQLSVLEQSLDLATGAMDLTLAIEAGPRVDLRISGLDMSERQQREALSIFEFGTVADWALKESRHEIVLALQRRGHWRPLVSYGRERDASGRNVEVQIRVLAGDKHSLSRVEFSGVADVDNGDLRAAIRTGEGALLQPARFISEYWDQDRNAALSLMRRRGYRDARIVDAPVGMNEDGDLVAAMIIDAGERVLVHDVHLLIESDGEPVPGISEPIWLAALQLRPGGPFDAGAVSRDTDRLRALLASSGYERGLVESWTEDLEGGGVSVRHRIFPGERVRVTRIVIAGNDHTRADAIERELAFLVGSIWSFSDVLDSQSRLYQLGVFDEIDIQSTEPDPISDQRTVAVRVHEAPPKFYSFGLGYDTEEKLRGSFAVGHGNVFGGGEQVSLSTRLSTREQRFRLLFRDPWFIGRRLDSTATVFYSDVREPSFKVQRYGGIFQVLVQRSREVGHLARAAFRDVTTYDIEIDPDLIEPEDQATTVGSVGYTLFRDTRSDPIDPRDGSYHTLDVDVATRVLGSATDFVTLFGRSFWYRDVGRGVVVALAGRFGLQFPYAGTTDVPLPERFFSGGSTTLRAFGLDEAGPLDSNGNPLGGEALLIGNAEIRVPLRGQLGAVLFADVGNVFAKPRDIRWSEVREMAGIGARYATPVGPIRLDFAWLLDRREGESATRLYFSVGHTF